MFMELNSDRTEGGGRDQIAAVAGQTFTEAMSESVFNHPLMRALLTSPNKSIGFAGIGSDLNERRGSRLINYDNEGKLAVSFFETTHHLEDIKLVHLALLEMLKGKNVLIKANDTDIWLIAMLIISKHLDNSELGTLFVETTSRMVDGFDTSLINCNEAAQTILKDVRLNHIEDPILRMLTFTTVCVALGGDTTHATKGVSLNKGISQILNRLASYIEATDTPLVRYASLAEQELGFYVYVEFEPYQRMIMVIFAELNHEAICDNWGSKSPAEVRRFLDGYGYENFEKLIAQVALLELGLMPSLPNCEFCMGRVICRVNTWYSTDEQVKRSFPLLGFDVLESIEGNGSSSTRHEEPNPDDLAYHRCLSEPKLTRTAKGEAFNSGFKKLFEMDGGAFGALYLQRIKDDQRKKTKRRSKSKRTHCTTCRHAYHLPDEDCTQCKQDSCGKHSCVEVCKRCLHKTHKGEKCLECSDLVSGRKHCEEHCVNCRRPKVQCTCTVQGGASVSPPTPLTVFDSDSDSEENDEHSGDLSDEESEELLGPLELIERTHGDLIRGIVGVSDSESIVAVLENMDEWELDIQN